MTGKEHTVFALTVPQEPIAIAVSGGSDSMALAYALKEAGAEVQAFIVDHRLRVESSEEAAQVKLWLENLNIPATILVWEHDGVDARIHARARAARYDLMTKSCKMRGISKLYVAHHQDDQAETILMRFAKGSGIDGLAGMARESQKEGVQIVRPFLHVPKAELLALCKAHKIPFVSDPSNEKERYARGRLRKVSALLADEGFTSERLADLGARAREVKEALDFYTHDLCQHAVTVLKSGALELDLEVWRKAPVAVRLRVLDACLRIINPTPYAPERSQLLPLADWMYGGEEGGRTLHGATLCQRKTTLRFVREEAAINHKLAQDGLWDGRWLVEGLDEGSGQHVARLGVQEHRKLDAMAPDLRKAVPSGRQRAVLPALWQGEALLAILGVCESPQTRVTASLKTPFWAKPL